MFERSPEEEVKWKAEQSQLLRRSRVERLNEELVFINMHIRDNTSRDEQTLIGGMSFMLSALNAVVKVGGELDEPSVEAISALELQVAHLKRKYKHLIKLGAV